MLELIVSNDRTRISGALHENVKIADGYHQAIRRALGYMVPDVEFIDSYRDGVWDGIISLYDRRTQSFPTGVLKRTIQVIKELELPFVVRDERVCADSEAGFEDFFTENGKDLRFYQTDAVEKAVKASRGVVAIATGGGKTLVICDLICKLNVAPVVYVVPSRSLLVQSHSEFTENLRQKGEVPFVGRVGDGYCEINPHGINVMTYQSALAAFNEKFATKTNKIVEDELAGEPIRKTLDQLVREYKTAKTQHELALEQASKQYDTKLKIAQKQIDEATTKKTIQAAEVAWRKIDKARKSLLSAPTKKLQETHTALENRRVSLNNKQRVRDMIANCACLIIDEAHLAAVIIEQISLHAKNAYYKYGTTATPFREDNQEIRIEGATGRKLVEISASDLIEWGYLVPANIYMIEISHRNDKTPSYRETYREHIVECHERNYRIKQLAEEFKKEGRPVLILVEQKDHGEILEKLIEDAVFVSGSDDGPDETVDEQTLDYRRSRLRQVQNNEIILIATSWAYTGVDAPKISTLILAGSNKSAVTTYQQVGRVLRLVGRTFEDSVRNGKAEAAIIDFDDKHPDLKSHSKVRRQTYLRERGWNVHAVKPGS